MNAKKKETPKRKIPPSRRIRRAGVGDRSAGTHANVTVAAANRVLMFDPRDESDVVVGRATLKDVLRLANACIDRHRKAQHKASKDVVVRIDKQMLMSLLDYPYQTRWLNSNVVLVPEPSLLQFLNSLLESERRLQVIKHEQRESRK